MSEQILSQDEIDALLGAMAKGEVELESEEKENEEVNHSQIETYDLTSKNILLQNQFFALNHWYKVWICTSQYNKLIAILYTHMKIPNHVQNGYHPIADAKTGDRNRRVNHSANQVITGISPLDLIQEVRVARLFRTEQYEDLIG